MNFKRLTTVYIWLYTCVFLLVLLSSPVNPIGECDDYALAAVSIMNDGTFGVSGEDIALYRELFAEWKDYPVALSGRFTRGGEELTFYFPTYSMACMPLLLLFRGLSFRLVYAFPLTNLISWSAMLWVVSRCLHLDERKKFLLILLLSSGTVCPYFSWPSAEVFIAALLGCSLVFWCNGNYKRAAVFLALAGTMNPAVLATGLVMIAEFLYLAYRKIKKQGRNVSAVGNELLQTVSFGSCFLLGLVPFAYNYYHTGFINLTASYASFLNSETSVFARFCAYLFDLNFGILPYYPVILVLAFVMAVMVVIRKCPRFLTLLAAWVATVWAYSYMTHINCGMSGIARYSVWAVLILIFAVAVYWERCFDRKKVLFILLALSCAYQGVAVSSASSAAYTEMVPLAKRILSYCPALYNPLPSTFNSRVIHLDGGYSYETPIVYWDSTDSLRKVLASEKDAEKLLHSVSGSEEDMRWFTKAVEELGEKASYISVPRRRTLKFCRYYTVGTPLIFYQEGYNVEGYLKKGFSQPEATHTWTDGTETQLNFRLESGLVGETLEAWLQLKYVFNGQQTVTITVNGECVFDGVVSEGEDIYFSFTAADEIVDIIFYIPDSVSPLALGVSQDDRQLALAFQSLQFRAIK